MIHDEKLMDLWYILLFIQMPPSILTHINILHIVVQCSNSYSLRPALSVVLALHFTVQVQISWHVFRRNAIYIHGTLHALVGKLDDIRDGGSTTIGHSRRDNLVRK